MSKVIRILIVDDDPDTCSSLRRILQLDGYQVDIAHTIKEMLTARNWSEYFAIVLDRKLPDGVAEDHLAELKQRAPLAAIVIVTGYADLESSIEALRLGADDYILKPINPTAFRSALERLHRIRLAEEKALQSERLSGIGQMITGIAHESRNAIQRIQSSVDMLKLDQDAMPNDAAEQIRKIETASDDLNKMLNEIRDYAAPINLVLTEEDLSNIWRRAWTNVLNSRSDINLELQEKVEKCNLRCTVDSFRIEQVFRNLFENSIAACKTSPLIQIECSQQQESPASSIRISVKDNGPGFDLEDAQNVFEPFFTTKQKGTGLGLAIVQRVINAHGGNIEAGRNGIETNGRLGAEVILTLPT